MADTDVRSSKVRRLRERYEASVQAVHASRGEPAHGADVLAMLIDIDPTPGLTYAKAIIRWFMLGSLRMADVEEAKVLVGRFHAQRKVLPRAARDITVHRSPSALKAMLEEGGH